MRNLRSQAAGQLPDGRTYFAVSADFLATGTVPPEGSLEKGT